MSSASGIVALVIAAMMFLYAVVGRLFHFHRPIPWVGGGHLTLVAELAGAGFVACIASAGLRSSPLMLLAFPMWLILHVSQTRANRQFHDAEDRLRSQNAKRYPGIFDRDPPEELEAIAPTMVDLYDCGACVYIGRIPALDLKQTIDATEDVPDQGPNDIFLVPEALESPAIYPVSNDLKRLLDRHFESRDHAILRWLPATQTTNNNRLQPSGGSGRS